MITQNKDRKSLRRPPASRIVRDCPYILYKRCAESNNYQTGLIYIVKISFANYGNYRGFHFENLENYGPLRGTSIHAIPLAQIFVVDDFLMRKPLPRPYSVKAGSTAVPNLVVG